MTSLKKRHLGDTQRMIGVSLPGAEGVFQAERTEHAQAYRDGKPQKAQGRGRKMKKEE